MSILTDRLTPRESANYIVKNGSGQIKLSDEGVKRAAEIIVEAVKSGEFGDESYSSVDVHPHIADRKAVDWIFLVDTINFSFWSDEKTKFHVTYNGKQYSGYLAACACINRALDENVPITNANFMEKISDDDVRMIFKTDDGSEIPLLHERTKVLNEAGKVLNEKFDGSFYNCILNSQRSAITLMKNIVENFESFRDFAIYKEQEVSFLKRAQILVSDIYLRMSKDDDACNFHDYNDLTMFADYRIPQTLCFLGVLQYSPDLMEKLEKKELLPNGSENEVEIRGFSIAACEAVVQNIHQIGKTTGDDVLQMMNAAQVDNFLWLYRRKNASQIEKLIPFHRTRCIYY